VFDLKSSIAVVPDFPKKGIMFRDITTMLKDPKYFGMCITDMVDCLKKYDFDTIVGIESRGFIFASVLAHKFKVGLVLARKPGKLPRETESQSFSLEYGKDAIEIHKSDVEGRRVVIIDDVLATGGTIEAVCKVIEKCDGKVESILTLVELVELNGKKKFKKYVYDSLVKV